MQKHQSPYGLTEFRKYFSSSAVFDLIEQGILFAASEFPEEFDSRRDRIAQILCTRERSHVKEPMAEKVSNEKVFCLYGTGLGHQPRLAVTVTVSTDTTAETTNAELVNRAHRFKFLPDKTIVPIGIPAISKGTTLVSVGSEVYCIGGGISRYEPCNEVKKFETLNLKFQLESCDNMIQPRAFSAVVSVDKKIFVFGGLPLGRNIHSTPWAEFLDTNKPKEEQKWQALEEPIFRPCRLYGCTMMFAIPYETQTILIGCGHDIEDAILYNVADGSWSKYNFPEDIRLWNHIEPITVISDKTMYWIHGTCLIAYELESHIYYFANMTNFRFPEAMFRNERRPTLVHLKDKLFGVLRVFSNDLKKTRIVECTKFQVSKGHQGTLELRVVGYQSYRCDPLYKLCGAISI